jgi:hypothetical protein
VKTRRNETRRSYENGNGGQEKLEPVVSEARGKRDGGEKKAKEIRSREEKKRGQAAKLETASGKSLNTTSARERERKREERRKGKKSKKRMH